jgi:hypothetical protein
MNQQNTSFFLAASSASGKGTSFNSAIGREYNLLWEFYVKKIVTVVTKY